jgi:hypothetical protein
MSSPAAEPPASPRYPHIGFTGGRGSKDGFTGGNDIDAGGRGYRRVTPRTPRKTNGGYAGGYGGYAA